MQTDISPITLSSSENILHSFPACSSNWPVSLVKKNNFVHNLITIVQKMKPLKIQQCHTQVVITSCMIRLLLQVGPTSQNQCPSSSVYAKRWLTGTFRPVLPYCGTQDICNAIYGVLDPGFVLKPGTYYIWDLFQFLKINRTAWREPY